VKHESLIAAATAARERAFAPFSKFQVGAAIETADGIIVSGCNVESASYGLTMCAERVAVFKGVSEGMTCFHRVVIVTDTEHPTPPCGACRQLLWEFAPDADVLLVNLQGKVLRFTVRELIPHAFDTKYIGG
jgi:cytidine deaminase